MCLYVCIYMQAVNSMLRSLDPYTEFENLQSAVEMKESVTGKIGIIPVVVI